MEQRYYLAGIVAAIIIIGAVGIIGLTIFSPPPLEPGTIRYGGQYYPGEFLLQGYPSMWDKYDINVSHTLFSSGTEGNEALIGGSVDVNVGSDTKTIALFMQDDFNPLIIGTTQRGNRYSTIIPADSNVTSWTELVGKTIGYVEGTGADTIMQRYFAADPDGLGLEMHANFTWDSRAVTTLPSALQSGLIDAFTAWELTPTVAVDQGIGKILRSYGDVALTPVSIHTTVEYARDNPDLLIAFLAGHLDKQDMIENDTSTAAGHASTAASDFGGTLSTAAFEGLFNRINYQIEFDAALIADIDATAEFLVENMSKYTSVPTLVYNTSFVEAAKELRATLADLPMVDGSYLIDNARYPHFASKASVLDIAAKIAYEHGLGISKVRQYNSLLHSMVEKLQELLLQFIHDTKVT
jgi:NitT/TauT family transport system substrate-binding protein